MDIVTILPVRSLSLKGKKDSLDSASCKYQGCGQISEPESPQCLLIPPISLSLSFPLPLSLFSLIFNK